MGRQLVQQYSDNNNNITQEQSRSDRKTIFDYERFLIDKIKPIFEHLSFINFFQTATKSEVIEFMRGVMDEFTHLAYFSKPVDPSLIIVVTAGKDGYVPRTGTVGLSEIWPEAEFRYIKNKGHVGAFLFEQPAFR